MPSLSALAQLPRITTGNIADLPAAKRIAKRVGRGPGSGKGKTSARGHKGQGKYGTGKGPGFEGGQTPLWRIVPKRGRNNPFKVEYDPLDCNKVQLWIDSGRLDPKAAVTMKTLRDVGLVSKTIKHGVKLLGKGDKLVTPLNIEVSRASQSAIQAVEKAGGKITCAYYTPLNLRALLKPEKFAVIPKRALPLKPKVREWYMSWTNRGYLATPPESS